MIRHAADADAAQARSSRRLPSSPNAHSATYLFTHRRLLYSVTKNELAARYAGSVLGIGWLILTPVLFLAIYAVVYLLIYRLRVPGLSTEQYVLYIIAGLVPFLVTAESLSTGVSSVVANKAVLSNVVFPIDLVPAKAVLGSQVTMAIGTVAILGASIVIGSISWTVLLVPIVWVLQVAMLIGVTWLLSLLNIVLRDLTHAVSIFLVIMLVASPIAYTPDMVPDNLRVLLAANPFAYFIVAYQQLIVLGSLPTATQCIGIVVIAAVSFGLGGLFFARAKRALLDYA